nr:hypothetical protein CFP56_72564 [Quercus suber]
MSKTIVSLLQGRKYDPKRQSQRHQMLVFQKPRSDHVGRGLDPSLVYPFSLLSRGVLLTVDRLPPAKQTIESLTWETSQHISRNHDCTGHSDDPQCHWILEIRTVAPVARRTRQVALVSGLIDPQDSTMSDSLEPMLKIQGFPWLLRKSLGMVTVELSLVHKSGSPDSITAKTHIRPGSYETTEDTFQLDNEPHERSDKNIGKVVASARYLKIDEIQDQDVKDKVKAGNEGTGDVIEQATQAPEKNWETKGYWTFEVINGTRYLCRYTMVLDTKSKERHVLKSVYTYVREKF